MIWCEGVIIDSITKVCKWTIITHDDNEFHTLNNFLGETHYQEAAKGGGMAEIKAGGLRASPKGNKSLNPSGKSVGNNSGHSSDHSPRKSLDKEWLEYFDKKKG
jgi:hypothetical protein